jgi:hypothetical protein
MPVGVVIGLCCGALPVVGCERTEAHATALAQTPDKAGRGRPCTHHRGRAPIKLGAGRVF